MSDIQKAVELIESDGGIVILPSVANEIRATIKQWMINKNDALNHGNSVHEDLEKQLKNKK